VADKFAGALARTAGTDDGGDVRIELSPEPPRDGARPHRSGPGARGPHKGSRDGPPRGARAGNDAKPRVERADGAPKKAWSKKPHRKGRRPDA
jgi:ATP-dependent RNA helicase DeaD